LELLLLSSSVYGLPHGTQDQDRVEIRRKLAFEIPLQRRGTTSGTVGLGDSLDLLYTVPIELGNTVMAVNIGNLVFRCNNGPCDDCFCQTPDRAIYG
jgi:hypothetical protein